MRISTLAGFAIVALSAIVGGASCTSSPASITSAPALFFGDPKGIVGSVVSAGPSTAIYQIGCAKGESAEKHCPNDLLANPQISPWITIGQDFFGWNLSLGDALEETLSCTVSSTSSARCIERKSGSRDALTATITGNGETRTTTMPSSRLTTTITTETVLSYGYLTLTAGLEEFARATGGASKSSSSSSQGASGASESKSSSTGAASKETGLGLIAVAAAAVAGLIV